MSAAQAQAVADHFKVPHLSLPEEVSSADLDKTMLPLQRVSSQHLINVCERVDQSLWKNHFVAQHATLPCPPNFCACFRSQRPFLMQLRITQISSSVCHFRGYVLDAGSISGMGFDNPLPPPSEYP